MSLIFLQTRVSAVSRRVENTMSFMDTNTTMLYRDMKEGKERLVYKTTIWSCDKNLSLFPFLSSFVDVLFSSESGWKSPQSRNSINREDSRRCYSHLSWLEGEWKLKENKQDQARDLVVKQSTPRVRSNWQIELRIGISDGAELKDMMLGSRWCLIALVAF